MTQSARPHPTATSEAARPACWCLTTPLDTHSTGDEPPPLNDTELAMIEETALLETERVHGSCGLHRTRLVELAAILAAPARNAYIEARLNGLCEEGATEICRDVLATRVGPPTPQRP